MFVPGFLASPDLTKVAFALALVVLLVMELVRANTRANALRRGRRFLFADPVSEAMHRFFVAFTDDRDEGAVILSHFSLLVGMAAPLWVSPSSPAPAPAPEGGWRIPAALARLWPRPGRADAGGAAALLMPYAGLLSLGVLDTVGSFVGSLTPRRSRIRCGVGPRCARVHLVPCAPRDRRRPRAR